MDLFEALLLGMIQGATEFLPISSSGHLVIVPALLGWNEPSLELIAIAHVGTLLAVLVYFREDIWAITRAVLTALGDRRPMATPEARLGWYILAGTVPAALAGLWFEDGLDAIFGAPQAAAAFLLVTAALLLLAERALNERLTLADMGWVDAILIGLAQMLALLPGISRSGSTIAAGIVRGLDRATAARYSFLLGIPAIAGAGLLSVVELAQSPANAGQVPGLLVSFAAAAVVGYLCIHFLLGWLRRRRLLPFAVYCVALSLLYFSVVGWR